MAPKRGVSGGARAQPAAAESSSASSAPATAVTSTSSRLPLLAALAVLLVALALSQTSLFSGSTPASTVVQPHDSTLPTPPHWGTYRPGLYLGVRGLWPSSPLFGWLWSCATPSTCSAESQVNELRHDAEERDGVTKYGWLQHDGDGFGVQGILDRKMGVNFTTSFLRPQDRSDQWTMRIEANPIASTATNTNGKEPSAVSLYFYTSLADNDHTLELLSGASSTGLDSALGIRVNAGAESGGEFVVRADLASGTKATSPRLNSANGRKTPLDATYYYGVHIDPRPPSASLKQKQSKGEAPPQQYTWAAKEIVKAALVDQYRSAYQAHQSRTRGAQPPPPMGPWVATLPNTIERNANVLVVQRVLTLPFTMDFVVQPMADDEINSDSDAQEVGGTEKWFGRSLAAALTERSQKFVAEFDAKFPMATTGGAAAAAADREFGQALLSNLLGGIGYFHGSQLIEESPARPASAGRAAVPAKIRETGASTLFSCVPSRSFFPRGFMWDEGFHHLLVSVWNLDLSLDILASWFDQIQPGGWLPREQILGEEARRRVPSEFQAQKPSVANPPTMILALEKILERLQRREAMEAESVTGVSEETKRQVRLFNNFLLTWLPTLHEHVQWFFETQASSTTPVTRIDLRSRSSSATAQLPRSFGWAGRTLDHCLASGLDDYPRAHFLPSLVRDKVRARISPEQARRDEKLEEMVTVAGGDAAQSLASSIGAEGHVDLHAWMIVLAKTMAGLTDYLHRHQTENGATAAAEQATAAAAEQATAASTIDYASLSSTYGSYARDLSRTLVALHWNAKSRTFADYAYRNGTRLFATHIGYVTLVPLFLNVLEPDSNELRTILQQLDSESWSLWTSHGLRSLSAHDKFFGSKEDYWRGHVWINMQYLAAQALTHYATHADSPEDVRTLATRLGSELRANVAGNVAKEYRRTGYVWEQYHALDGRGRKSHPFTGWTALTLLIMSDMEAARN